MNQEWFEMPEVRRRTFQRSVWIPLRSLNVIEKIGQYGSAGYRLEHFEATSLAIPVEQKTLANNLSWMDIHISHCHSGCFEGGVYITANVYKHHDGELIGENLVLEQRGNSIENNEWHLSQDFAITLGLKREGDVWIRPNEGYIEIAKLYRRGNKGIPYLLEVRASHLRDYLCARNMALKIHSYRSRVEVVENADHITWEESPVTDNTEGDRWEGRISEIHEGGMPFGERVAIFHVARTDVDEEEDVPAFDFPTDDVVKSEFCTKEHHGRKLFRIEGELWRYEWIDPAQSSPIVRNDETQSNIYFIIDAEGTQENRDTLVHGSRWLWFRPEVITTLAHRRGGLLCWYSRDTGSVGCSPDYSVHFGINLLGLVNVYAKDIGRLPGWQQKIWSGYNVSPDGKVSEELLASQMRAEPADTKAPEAYLAEGFKKLNTMSLQKLGFALLKEHDYITELIEKTHRFRAVNRDGLFALAKDVARLTADRFDAAAIQTIVSPPKGTKWGSLKSMEYLIAKIIDPKDAHEMLSSLFGVYELRHGDAHLPSGDIDEVFLLIGVDQKLPYVHQGYQLLHACVYSIFSIASVISKWSE